MVSDYRRFRVAGVRQQLTASVNAPHNPRGVSVAGSVGATVRRATALLEVGLIERECEARLLLLALVGGEHLLLLGPPGTAKSELCRRLSTIARLGYFERTLTRFSTPEELFGPLSLAALERDEFRRATAGYAPTAELLFLDEIFKSNSAILNTLLTLLNERLFDDGAKRERVPLLSAVAASNEGPESDDLSALYDRFLLRRLVAPVSDDGVLELLLGGEAAEGGSVDAALPDLREALEEVRAAAPSVRLPRHVALLLRDARAFVRETGADGLGGGYVSDRRLRRSAELLKACAAAHGRDTVSVVDVAAVLPHVLWDTAEEAAALAEWVEDNALPDGGAEQLRFLLESAAVLRQRLLPRARESAEELEQLAAEAALFELALADGLDEEGWAALQAEDDLDGGGGGEAGTAVEAPSFDFDEAELSWGRKEAKAKLGPEEFRAWRKAAKAAARRGD
ncbi:hypothetical protein EMIHUDRAFT_200064 [Emiliania huxleyi CCMP1516]|uniref:AAA+ ATPase domain-containing protein n=2 Tax=Emiliania huxleyi TaxID=2903 RepID=A0A0D3KUX1_EMIH1|nr:hypothetical protein EMIHUDRAFT_200064 [Emiliania huxleyi CCMP1516]EOD39556.1 hypothetical protein EMIHUDRAFT_200064 [Emiliania huxleyi CCMP1516]|eukprot:XP_005791985.1 hypothetical protein EMIHUDRAFT_200064 [Emiliania huxleyi CCMP1516]